VSAHADREVDPPAGDGVDAPSGKGPKAGTLATWIAANERIERAGMLATSLDHTLAACSRAVQWSRSLRSEVSVDDVRSYLRRSRFHWDVLGSLVTALEAAARPRRDWRAAHEVIPGQLRLLPERQSVEVASGRRHVLTRTEWQLLTAFLARPGRVLTRDELVTFAWGDSSVDRSSEVEVYISRLRRKIEADPQKPRLIETVRGVGYRFNQPEGAAEVPVSDGNRPAPRSARRRSAAADAGSENEAQSAVDDSSTPA